MPGDPVSSATFKQMHCIATHYDRRAITKIRHGIKAVVLLQWRDAMKQSYGLH